MMQHSALAGIGCETRPAPSHTSRRGKGGGLGDRASVAIPLPPMSDLVTWLAPYSGWAILLALAVLGGAITTYALFADRARHRRCPRCGYDLSHSPTSVCSECGRTLRSERDGFRTRRRWPLAFVGLLVAIALPTFVVQRRVRQYGWAYYTYVGPLYWLWPDETVGAWATRRCVSCRTVADGRTARRISISARR